MHKALRRFTLPAAAATLALLGLAACNTAEARGGSDESTPDKTGATVELADTDLGEVLVDNAGMTLYMFTPDVEAGGESTCYDECEETWPPLTVDGDATVGAGVDQELMGTVERTDGSTQVTYNDMPLYLFGADVAPGDVTGQGVKDVWFAVDATGKSLADSVVEEPDEASADLELADTADIGEVLVNAEGMTLYMFFKDEDLDGESACYDKCLELWTPLTVESDPVGGSGVKQDLLGTIERTDGSTQVTYNDLPLYTFNDDKAPGDIGGFGFKDVWCTVNADGEAPEKKSGY